jgi:hypothetical protein
MDHGAGSWSEREKRPKESAKEKLKSGFAFSRGILKINLDNSS